VALQSTQVFFQRLSELKLDKIIGFFQIATLHSLMWPDCFLGARRYHLQYKHPHLKRVAYRELVLDTISHIYSYSYVYMYIQIIVA